MTTLFAVNIFYNILTDDNIGKIFFEIFIITCPYVTKTIAWCYHVIYTRIIFISVFVIGHFVDGFQI